MSASTSASAAPAHGASGTPVKGAKAKPVDSRDAKPDVAQSTVSASLAVQPLMASGLAAPGSSQGSPQGADAAGTDSSSDVSGGNGASAPPVVTGVSGSHAAVTPAITTALLAPRQPAAPDADPGSLGDDSHSIAAAPDSGRESAAPISAPFHSALQSALSAATRLDGASQSPAASQPPGTTNDLASANAAVSAAAAPGATTQPGASVAPQAGTNVTTQVHAEVGSTGWANELGTRLHWMASQGIGSASLRLTPEQLGPVEVKISVHQNAASVWFSAAQPDTRSALEQALPRLRELFSAQGMNLAQAGVSDQSARGAPREEQAAAFGPRTGTARELNATSVTSAVRAHQGLIDTYA
jgi:flagellar hook-length control protein FliK